MTTFTNTKSSYRDLKAMHYVLRSMLPTSYFVYSVVGCINFCLLIYGFVASEVAGSFLNCLVGFAVYCAVSQAYASWMVRKDWQSAKLHNIALVGHLIVSMIIINYLFF